jgi:hypothetical protein
MVDAARPEPALGDLETAALAEQYVGGRYPDIVEHHLGMAVRGLVSRPITISTLQRGSSAPEVHHLRPLIT